MTATTEWSVSAITPGPQGTVDVVAAVAAAMAELPAIGKDQKAAKEQGGYPYRGIEAITGNLQALLAKHQVLTIPRAEILATVPSLGMNEGWTDTTLRVEWLIAGADGSSFTAVTNGIGRDKSDKGANKAQSQAYKYLLLPLFCIADRKDDADGDSYEDGRASAPTWVPATVEQVAEFHQVKDRLDGVGLHQLKEWFAKNKVPAVATATETQVLDATAAARALLPAEAAAEGDGAEPTTAGSAPDPDAPGAYTQMQAEAEAVAAQAAGEGES